MAYQLREFVRVRDLDGKRLAKPQKYMRSAAWGKYRRRTKK